MNDCTNAEMRDQLPDLVHERLSEDARMIVIAHVDGCVDCRDEVELLRSAKALLGRGIPRVDVAYVVGGLPKAPAPRAAIKLEPQRRTRNWSDWRIAAAVTLLLAGGGSYAVMRSGPGANVVDTVGAVAVAPTTFDSAPDIGALVTPDDDQPAAMGSMDARLGDLNEDQLSTLLNDIDNLRAEPAGEPEPVSLRGDATSSLESM